MSINITTDLITEKNKLVSARSWLWLVEVDIDGQEALRLTTHDVNITWNSNTYYPYPMGVTNIEQDTQGNVNSINLTVSNIGLIGSSLINSGKIDGREVRLRLVHEDHLSDPNFVIESKWLVSGVSYDHNVMTVKLSMINLLNIDFPRERFFRTRCRYVSRYGGLHCGYNKDLPNMISSTNPDFNPSSCDGTLDGENGCTVHGLNEEANNLPKEHPKRFGGYPGIPRGPIFTT